MESENELQIQHDTSILEYVNREYERTGRPVLLSQVGTNFCVRFGNFRNLYSLSLSEYVRRHLNDKLRFASGKASGPGAAVEPISVDNTTTAVTTQDGAKLLPKDQLDKYPRSLVIAFCLKPNEFTDVYYGIDPPYRYYEIPVHDPAPGPRYCLVDKDLRIGKRSVDLTEDDRILLSDRISDWVRKNSLDTIVGHRRIRSPIQMLTPTSLLGSLTALQRQIQAQPPELQERLLIPADIAILLSKS